MGLDRNEITRDPPNAFDQYLDPRGWGMIPQAQDASAAHLSATLMPRPTCTAILQPSPGMAWVHVARPPRAWAGNGVCTRGAGIGHLCLAHACGLPFLRDYHASTK